MDVDLNEYTRKMIRQQ